MTAPRIYQYSKCGTCRKALKFLEEHGASFDKVDIVTKPPSATTLRKALSLSGGSVRKLFNTSGQSYRNGGFKDKLSLMSDDQALAALAADGKLIKRPLVLSDGFALVGFREDEWKRAFGI